MNMSYCRYENTLEDLRDCINNAMEHVDEEAEYSVSKSEISCFRNMVEEFFEFMDSCGIIDYENECIDEDELDDVCKKMKKSYDDYEYDEDED